MTTCNIYFYQCEIVPARNCRVDEIEHYLGSLTPVYYYTDFQHQRIDLDIDVTIPYREDTADFNYCKIEQDGEIYYFFVNQPRRRNGYNSITFSMSLDTVNTFWTGLRWSWKTNIIREHRPRYDLTHSDPSAEILVRSIDWRNEGLNPVKTIVKNSNVIGNSTEKWYMVYTSSNELTQDNTTDPVRVLVLKNSEVTISGEIDEDEYTLNPSLGYIYFVTASDNSDNDTTVTIGSKTFTIGSDTESNAVLRAVKIVKFQTSADPVVYAISVTPLYYTGNSYPYSYKENTGTPVTVSNISTVTINNTRFYHKSKNQNYYQNLYDLTIIDGIESTTINAGSVPAVKTSAYSNFDRSDPRFTKIIEIPYQPADLTSFDIDYGYKTYSMPLTDFTMNRIIGSNTALLTDSLILRHNPSLTDTFSSEYESKIHSSEFESLYLTYDNSVLVMKQENFTFTDTVSEINLYIHMYISNDMSGNKMFEVAFDSKKYSYNWDSDFEDSIISTRSTEKPIYTSGYADYIKNGYNYDQEAVKRQNTLTTISAVLNGISGAVSLAGGALGLASKAKTTPVSNLDRLTSGLLGNPEISETPSVNLNVGGGLVTSFATSMIASGVGQASNIISAVTSIDTNNRNFANGLNQKMASSVIINGQASTDLMDYYGGGKLHFTKRVMRSDDIDTIAKMFHLIGYAYPKREIPDFTSRTWFNYVQCDPVFLDENTSVFRNYLDDIKTRFKAGVTVFHSVNSSYDFNQERENWETALISA